jgi:hypothetical protein
MMPRSIDTNTDESYVREGCYVIDIDFSYTGRESLSKVERDRADEAARILALGYDAAKRYAFQLPGHALICPPEFLEAFKHEIEEANEDAEAFNERCKAQGVPERITLKIYSYLAPRDSFFERRVFESANKVLARMAEALETKDDQERKNARRALRNLDMILEGPLRLAVEEVFEMTNARRTRRDKVWAYAPFVKALAERFQ